MNDLELQILRSGHANLAFFLRADLPSGTLRLFAGAGDFRLPIDAVETTGGVYTSAGSWGGGLPDVDHLMNAEAQGLTLSLSGVDTATVRQYLLDRSEVVGAPAAMGWAVLDERYRPAGPMRWPTRGGLFEPRVSRQRAGEGTWTRVISTTLMSGPYARRRGLHTYLTGADQRRISPDDAFCDRTGLYPQQATRSWPD